MNDEKLDIIICLGKMLFTDSKPDWFLESRLNKTIEVALMHPQAKIILTGGKSHWIEEKIETSETMAMFDYITTKRNVLKDRVIIEDKGDSTIHQIIKIKTDIVMKSNYKTIGLITDEIHMPRAEATTRHIFGAEYKIIAYAAEVRISGHWRRAIEEAEKKIYELTLGNRISTIREGDHEEWRRLNEEWKALTSEEKEKILNTKF